MEQELIRAATEASIKDAQNSGYVADEYNFGGEFAQIDLSKFGLQPQLGQTASKPMSKKEIKMCLVIQGYQIADIDRALSDIKSLKPTLEEVKKRLQSYNRK